MYYIGFDSHFELEESQLCNLSLVSHWYRYHTKGKKYIYIFDILIK